MTTTSILDTQGQRLLALLVSKLPHVNVSDPRTFVSYKDVHDLLELPQMGETFGESLTNGVRFTYTLSHN